MKKVLALAICVALLLPMAQAQAKKQKDPLSVEFKGIREKARYSSRKAASLTKTPAETLSGQDYVKIGVVEAAQVTRRCESVKGDLRCQDLPADGDLTAEILKAAARAGGDLVELSVDREKKENLQEGKRCLRYESAPGYQYVYNWATKSMDLVYGSSTQCAEWAQLLTSEDLIRSTGVVWRKDPELAREFRRAEELITAAGTGDLEKLDELVKGGVDLNRTTNNEGSLALSSAALMGQLEAARFLVEKGADVNAFDRVASPLYQAAFGKNVEVVRFLLDRGAKVDAKLPENKETTLHAAARSGDLAVMAVLLSHGAKVDALNEGGITPLMVAAHGGHPGAVKLLLDKGAEVNRVCTAVTPVVARWTPLMFSVLSGDRDTVLVLLEGGADPQTRSYYGRRAVDNAEIFAGVGISTPEVHQILKAATEGIWGYIDKTGRYVIGPEFSGANFFFGGLAVVTDREGKKTLIDKKGKAVLRSQDDINFWVSDEKPPFSHGPVGVKVGEKWGYVDRQGRLVIEPRYDFAGAFVDGAAIVGSGGEKHYIDKTGKVLFDSQLVPGSYFVNGLAEAGKDGRYGIIDRSGTFVVPAEFDGVGLPYFHEGLQSVRKGDKWGFIDRKGRMVIPPAYDRAFIFQDGLAQVIVKEKIGFIDKTGNMVVEPIYVRAANFSGGTAFVQKGGKWGVIDRTGAYVVTPAFTEVDWIFGFSEELAAVKAGKKWGFIDRTGRMVIEPSFEKADRFREGLAAVMVEGKWGFIDPSGKMVIEPKFSGDNLYGLTFWEGLAAAPLSGMEAARYYMEQK